MLPMPVVDPEMTYREAVAHKRRWRNVNHGFVPPAKVELLFVWTKLGTGGRIEVDLLEGEF